MKTLLTVLIFVGCMVLFSKCDARQGETPSLANATRVIYHFGDSSVPPEYHRSHTLTVTKSNARLVVDSYGKIVDEATVIISEEQFNQVLKTIRDSKIAVRRSVKEDEGCSGGTSESLEILEGESVLFKADIYHCGGSDYGTLTGDIKAVKEKLKSLFPDFRDELKKPKSKVQSLYFLVPY